MIAFISLATDWTPGSAYAEQYAQHAKPWILRQPDAMPKTVLYWGNIMAGMNEGMDWATKQWPDPPFEAIVFVHPDCEILDPLFTEKVRAYLKDPTVGMLGVIGSRGAASMEWWSAPELHGWIHHKEGQGGVYFDTGDHDVDIVDGCLFVLTPPMFDYRWPAKVYGDGHHGYEAEAATEARRRGLRVVQIDAEARHATVPKFAGGREAWDIANGIFRSRWGPFLMSKGRR